MKQKRFIKMLRGLGYPRYQIESAVNAVKSCGGRLSYKKFTTRFVWYRMLFSFSLETIVKLIISELSIPRLAKGGIVEEPTLAKSGEDGLPRLYALDESDATGNTSAWRKENPYIKVAIGGRQ